MIWDGVSKDLMVGSREESVGLIVALNILRNIQLPLE
jgi:hypothetical protein